MSEETKEKGNLPEKKKRALLSYLAILFCAAFILVLLSFLIQLRDSNSTISDLSKASSTALANAQRLQDDNAALRDEVKSLQEELDTAQDSIQEAQKSLTEREAAEAAAVSGLEDALKEKEAALKELEKALSDAKAEAEKSAEAQAAVLQLCALLAEKDPAKAADLKKQLEEKNALLPEAAQALLNAYQLPEEE